MRASAVLVAAVLLALAGEAVADFRSVAAPAVAYDTPSERGKNSLWFARLSGGCGPSRRGLGARRDPAGELSWLPAKALSDHRTVVVTAATATVRERPDDDAPAVFQAATGVILEYAEPGAPGWIRVRHRDGPGGFVHISQVWGG